MNPLKKLAGETVIYGFSTILARFINWLLNPLYTELFPAEEYGVVINLMSYMALLTVLLTYGTETGFFRFATTENKNHVFSTLMTSLSVTTLLFLGLFSVWMEPILSFLDLTGHREYLIILVLTLAIDVMNSIPFALLRLEGRPIRFGLIKLINIGINIGCNLFFLLFCPWLERMGISLPFYDPAGGILYVFISYLVATVVTSILLLPYLTKFRFYFSIGLLKKIVTYSFPILVVSLAGMINLQGDKILMPKILGQIMSSEEAKAVTGIYGANYKLALIMYIFTQGFRYAFEPFFFSYSKNEDSKKVYRKVFLYFTGFGLIIFLGIMYWLDILQYLISQEYRVGLIIIPWVLMANLFQGMYYSLSLWYKLTDKTIYGACMALAGSVISVSMNVWLLPIMGYMASAYAVFTCFLAMSVLSLWLGKRYYRISYDIKKILFYFFVALLFCWIGTNIRFGNDWTTCLFRTPLLLLFIFIFIRMEMKFLLSKEFVRKLFPGKK